MKKGFLMVLVAFVSLLLCVVPIKVEAKSITCNYVNPYGGDLVLTFGDKPETGYYVNNNYNNVFIDSGTSSIKKFYFGEISNKGNLNTAGSFSYHGKNWVFDETLRGPFGECPLLEYLEVKDNDSKDYTMLSSKNSEYCSRYNCNSVQLKDFSVDVGPIESTESKTCKYKNPFGGDDIEIFFTKYENDYLDGKTGKSKNGIYVGESKSFSSIVKAVSYLPWNSNKRKFYVKGAQLIGGRLWAFDEYFVEKDQVEEAMQNGTSFVCPSLMYSTDVTEDNVDSVIVHMSSSFYCSDSATSMATCKPMLLVNGSIVDEDGIVATKVDDCSFDFKTPNLNLNYSINFDLYSNNSIKWSAKDVNGSVDLSQDYPVYFYDKGNRVIVKIGKEDIKKLLSSNGSKLTCNSGSICELNGSLLADHEYIITSDVNKCPEDIWGNTSENDVEVGDGSVPGSNIGSNITKPSTNVNSNCSAYLGIAGAGENIATFLDNIWGIIKVGSILLLIVFSMIDFAKAVTDDKEKVPAVVKKSTLRLFFLVAILLLPTIIDAIGNLVGVDNILCGIK